MHSDATRIQLVSDEPVCFPLPPVGTLVRVIWDARGLARVVSHEDHRMEVVYLEDPARTTTYAHTGGVEWFSHPDDYEVLP